MPEATILSMHAPTAKWITLKEIAMTIPRTAKISAVAALPWLLMSLAGNVQALPVYVDTAGNTWRQLAPQNEFSWTAIDGICSNDGITACGSGLDGTLEGWVWATSQEVSDLFQEFGTHPGTALVNITLGADPNTALFFSKFDPTNAGSGVGFSLRQTTGWTADTLTRTIVDPRTGNTSTITNAILAQVSEDISTVIICDPTRTPQLCSDFVFGQVTTTKWSTGSEQSPGSAFGAWLFKPAAQTVPEPTTLSLAVIGLAVIGSRRRYRRTEKQEANWSIRV